MRVIPPADALQRVEDVIDASDLERNRAVALNGDQAAAGIATLGQIDPVHQWLHRIHKVLQVVQERPAAEALA